MGIDKTTAALLFAYGYKLIDKEGKIWHITSVFGEGLGVNNSGKLGYNTQIVKFDELGSEYFVLCRNKSSLTETIEHEGNHIVPIVEIAKECCPYDSVMVESFEVGTEDSIWVNLLKHNGDVLHSLEIREGNFYVEQHHERFLNQEALFNKLYSYHFPLSGLDESQIKYIKD